MLNQAEIDSFLNENALDGVFILKDENCRYISGFTGSDSYLLLTKGRSYLLTDSRYMEQAQKEALGFDVVNHAGKLAETISRLISGHHTGVIGIEPELMHKTYLSLKKNMEHAEFRFCDVDKLRQIKSSAEIRLIREACRISDAGFEKVIPFIREGITESKLRMILECAMLEAGSEGKSFDTIVASGERSSYPHGTATDKVINNGDLVTFDFGAIYKGYHSDITRTVAVGAIIDKQRNIYDAVLGCNEYIEKSLRAGLVCSDVDQSAREYLKKYGYDTYFIHSLGHSVGLEIHETPALSPNDHSVLKENMIETVEPGVYIPGIGGVRIEDTVVIQKDGIEVLTKFPKKFLKVQ